MAVATRIDGRRGKRPEQAARATLRDLRARTRVMLLRLLGGHDAAIMHGDLCRRGPGCFDRWVGVLTWRLANQRAAGAVVVSDVPRLVRDAYVLLGAEREYQATARRILRGEQG